MTKSEGGGGRVEEGLGSRPPLGPACLFCHNSDKRWMFSLGFQCLQRVVDSLHPSSASRVLVTSKGWHRRQLECVRFRASCIVWAEPSRAVPWRVLSLWCLNFESFLTWVWLHIILKFMSTMLRQFKTKHEVLLRLSQQLRDYPNLMNLLT